MSSHGGIVSERPPMPAKALVAGEVCKSCNAGWMSELEERAQPLLLAGVRPEKPRYLDCDAQLALARWFFKTAIVLNSSQNWRLLLPREVRHSARAGVHPDVRILVAQRTPKPSDQVEFYQGFTGMITFVPEDRASAMGRAGERIYAGWIGVADWYGVVIYAPPGWWPNPVTEFRQLWPYQGDFDWADIPAWSNLAEELILTGDQPPGLLDDPELLAGPDLPLHLRARRRG